MRARRLSLYATLGTLLLSACADEVRSGTSGGTGPAAYEQHRALWQTQGIATYSFSLYIGAFEDLTGPFCGEAQVWIGVEEWTAVSVREPSGCAVDPVDPSIEWVPFTSDELFDLISQNGNRPRTLQ